MSTALVGAGLVVSGLLAIAPAAPAAAAPVGCSNDFFYIPNAAPSTVVDRTPAGTETTITTTVPGGSFSLALDPVDGQLYTVSRSVATGNHLYIVAADGTTTDLGVIAGVPTGAIAAAVGFDNNGTLWMEYGGSTLYRVDLSTMTATVLPTTNTFPLRGDLAYLNGVMYGAVSTTANNLAPYSLARIDLTTGAVTAVSVPGMALVTSLWSVQGHLYMAQGTSMFEVLGYDTATPTLTTVATLPGAPADGASCALATSPFINAADDDFTSSVIIAGTPATTATVFADDTINGAAFAPAAVTATLTNDGGLTGATIAADGTIAVPATALPGDYSLSYQICETANPSLCDPAVVTIRVAAAAPALTVTKTADVTTITQAGQKVTYSFVVANTGNVTMSDIAINEGAFSGAGALAPVVCPQPTLAPAAGETCTTTYTVMQADVDAGTLTNTATATGVAPGSPAVVPSQPSTSTIAVDRHASLTVVKSASPAAPADFAAGENITYSFLITNTGNVTLSNAAIVEGAFTGSGTLPAPTCPGAANSIAPSAQVVCTTTYTVTQADVDAGSISNTGTAVATPPGSTTAIPSQPSTVTVPEAASPGATLVKTSDVQKVTTEGQVVHYSFTVTNTGNTTLTHPTINEGAFTGHGTLSTPICPTGTAALLPGQKIVCTATYTVVAADLSGDALANTATATVTSAGGGTVTSDPSTATSSTVDATAVPAGSLASTGSTIAGGAGIAGTALLIAGGVLLLIRRRRTAE